MHFNAVIMKRNDNSQDKFYKNFRQNKNQMVSFVENQVLLKQLMQYSISEKEMKAPPTEP